jgi:hypothetical protein
VGFGCMWDGNGNVDRYGRVSWYEHLCMYECALGPVLALRMAAIMTRAGTLETAVIVDLLSHIHYVALSFSLSHWDWDLKAAT